MPEIAAVADDTVASAEGNMDADAGVPTQVAVGDDDAVEEHGVQGHLSVIESPELDSKKTELITAMLRLETRPRVLKVFSERAMWRGQGEEGYFHGAPEDWNCVVAALGSETLCALVAPAIPAMAVHDGAPPGRVG